MAVDGYGQYWASNFAVLRFTDSIDPIEVGVSDAVVLKSAQCVQCVQRSTVIETAADRGEV